MLLLNWFNSDRKLEMTSNCDGKASREPIIELFGFYLASSEEEVYKIALKGFTCSKSSEEHQNYLGKIHFIAKLLLKLVLICIYWPGSSLNGIHLFKHLDVALLNHFYKQTSSLNFIIVKVNFAFKIEKILFKKKWNNVLKYTIKRSCLVKPSKGSNIRPNSNADAHCSLYMPSSKESLEANYKNSLVN